MLKQAAGILLAVGVVAGVTREPDFLARFRASASSAANGAGAANADGTFLT
jgi:hypothetical protein